MLNRSFIFGVGVIVSQIQTRTPEDVLKQIGELEEVGKQNVCGILIDKHKKRIEMVKLKNENK
jgi:hypothetical protein